MSVFTKLGRFVVVLAAGVALPAFSAPAAPDASLRLTDRAGDGSYTGLLLAQLNVDRPSGDAMAPLSPPPPPPTDLELQAPSLAPVPTYDPNDERRHSLQLEYSQLQNTRYSLGGPIAMMAVGGGLYVVGYVFMLAASSLYGSPELAVLSLTSIIGGTVLGIVGTVNLITTIVRKAKRSSRMRRIQKELRGLDLQAHLGQSALARAELPPVRGIIIPVAAF